MKKKTFIFAVLIFVSLVIFATGGQEVPDNGKKNIAVTFNAVKELTVAVAGDKVNVASIIPEGMGAHHFEPRPKDLAFLSKADILIFNGMGMEGWLDDAVKAVGNKKIVRVEASKGIEPIKLKSQHREGAAADHDDECDCPLCVMARENAKKANCSHGAFDPHTWLGISSAKIMVNNIERELSKLDSANSAYYKANAKAYIAKLDMLFNEYTQKFKTVKNKHFVTGHAAFAYLCRDFNLEQKAVRGVFSEGEPNAKALTELVEYCKTHNIKTVFAEDAASPEVSKTLAKEVNAKVEKIYTMETAEDNKSYFERLKLDIERIYANLKNE